jgi:methionyl-tRNA formyltransferase
MKIILCAYHWVGCKALEILLENDYEVFVYTHKAPPHIPSMVDFCFSRGVAFTTKKITSQNLPFIPDVISSVYYRYIISKEVIDISAGKIFNLHPSMLPNYKGCSSLTWAIINGERNTGYSYHYIDEEIDTGDIILQNKMQIEEFDTQQTLYERVMIESMKYYLDALDLVKNGSRIRKVQMARGNYYKRGCPFDGEIDDEWSENKIRRFIRAMISPPLPYARYRGMEVRTYEEFQKIRNAQTTS